MRIVDKYITPFSLVSSVFGETIKMVIANSICEVVELTKKLQS